MALITRVSRLFQADLHAVLDRIEEPELLLQQAVREMQDELSRQQQNILVLEQEQVELNSKESEIDNRLSEMERELDICFESEQEDLARTVVRRKLEAKHYLQQVRNRQERLLRTLTDLRKRQDTNRARLESMRQKAELFTLNDNVYRRQASWPQPDISISNDEVEVAFLGEREKRRAI